MYKCVTHIDCPFCEKIIHEYRVDYHYCLATNGTYHSFNEVKTAVIHPTVFKDVEHLLLVMGATKTINKLYKRYRKDDEMEK